MTTDNVDAGVRTVLDNMHIIVASEGGSLEFVDLTDGLLTVRYNQGYNEECPECVPAPDMVRTMMKTSLGIYAPHITEVELL